MVQLSWDVLGFIYEDGIRGLRTMFERAAVGLDHHIKAAYVELGNFDRAVEAGADSQIECDEDTGQVIYDHRDMLLYNTTTAEETKSILNKSIAVAAFHHWERSARDWTKRPNGKFATLCELVKAKGYPISPKLEQLYMLVNLLKHSNSKDGIKLYDIRPDLFRRVFNPTLGQSDWYAEILLSDDHMMEIFQVITTSGPSGVLDSPTFTS